MAPSNRPVKRQRLAGPSSSSRGDVPPPVPNHPPTTVLDVFVFGDGEAGELGLGPKVTKAKRPVLNPFLSTGFEVVQVACGGMHSIALTRDNRILTWGVNDNGALGRETAWEAPTKDAEADDDDDDNDNDNDEAELNPRESTPTAVPMDAFPPGTAFAQVAAGDSSSFVLTTTGAVYGWGSFRTPDGNEVFSPGSNHSSSSSSSSYIQQQPTPARIAGLDGITQLAVGANHALALDRSGRVWAWGSGAQHQLGFRLFDRQCPRDKEGRLLRVALVPHRVALPSGARAQAIASGEYHAFAVDTRHRVWAWGLDSFGETGADPAGTVSGRSAGGFELEQLPPPPKLQKEMRALAADHPSAEARGPPSMAVPTEVRALAGQGVVALAGGGHHSVAVTADGRCLAWGRLDIGQLGLALGKDHPAVQTDAHGRPAICLLPTAVSLPTGSSERCIAAACGTDHTILVTGAAPHAAFATGFNERQQLGLGSRAPDEVMTPQPIGGQALKGRALLWAGAGGQFSMVAGPRET